MTQFLFDGTQIIGEYNSANDLRRRFVPAGLDEPVVWYEGSGTTDRRWLAADQLGSIIAVMNASGAATNINTYDEYGQRGASNVGRFQYNGQPWLPEVSLYHYRARAYSPTLGRFMQTDPILHAGGMNLYGYVANDPVNRVDPHGHLGFYFGLDFDVGGGGVFGATVLVYRDFSITGGFSGPARGAVVYHGGAGYDNSFGIVAGTTGQYGNLLGPSGYGELSAPFFHGLVSLNGAVPVDGDFTRGTYQLEVAASISEYGGSIGHAFGYPFSIKSNRNSVTLGVSSLGIVLNGALVIKIVIGSDGSVTLIADREGSRVNMRLRLRISRPDDTPENSEGDDDDEAEEEED